MQKPPPELSNDDCFERLLTKEASCASTPIDATLEGCQALCLGGKACLQNNPCPENHFFLGKPDSDTGKVQWSCYSMDKPESCTIQSTAFLPTPPQHGEFMPDTTIIPKCTAMPSWPPVTTETEREAANKLVLSKNSAKSAEDCQQKCQEDAQCTAIFFGNGQCVFTGYQTNTHTQPPGYPDQNIVLGIANTTCATNDSNVKPDTRTSSTFEDCVNLFHTSPPGAIPYNAFTYDNGMCTLYKYGTCDFETQEDADADSTVYYRPYIRTDSKCSAGEELTEGTCSKMPCPNGRWTPDGCICDGGYTNQQQQWGPYFSSKNTCRVLPYNDRANSILVSKDNAKTFDGLQCFEGYAYSGKGCTLLRTTPPDSFCTVNMAAAVMKDEQDVQNMCTELGGTLKTIPPNKCNYTGDDGDDTQMCADISSEEACKSPCSWENVAPIQTSSDTMNEPADKLAATHYCNLNNQSTLNLSYKFPTAPPGTATVQNTSAPPGTTTVQHTSAPPVTTTV